MFLNLFVFITFFMILRVIRSETPKVTLPDLNPKSTLKSNLDNKSTPDTWDVSPKPNSKWVYRPSKPESHADQENDFVPVYFKGPLSVTRLTKPFRFGVDPFFEKEYFQPFERRQKPVTLIAFRRNGLLPRRRLKVEEDQPADVAEMQSPYNEVSSFWGNEEGLFNE